MFDLVNLLLKNNRGIDRKPHFVIFVILSTLVIGKRVVVAWVERLI